MINPVLNTVLAANLAFHPEYDHGLANHFSMGAVGLHLLGEVASLPPGHIKNFAGDYKERELLKPGPPVFDLARLEDADRFHFLGQGDSFDTWYIYFQKILTPANYQEITTRWLEKLGDGLAAGAGHGLLRVYFALKARPYIEENVFLPEMAMALAYYACRYMVLRRPGSSQKPSLRFEEALHHVPSLSKKSLDKLEGGRGILSRMLVCSWDSSYQSFVTSMDPNYNLLSVLTLLAGLAVDTADFTLLHGITVSQAVIELKELLPDLDEYSLRLGLIDFVTVAFMAKQLAYHGTPAYEPIDRDAVLDLVPSAKDVHSIKALYSLLDLHRRSRDPLFLASAKRYCAEYG